MNPHIRVRFAPAPTGIMHIGNIRTALLNYLFAQQKKGTFVVRIEDTDASRNFDPGAQTISADLAWLSLTYNEGPGKGGPYAPYFQSERKALYQEQLDRLINQKLVYRCFCTESELEKKRDRQRALKLPPRYDQTCFRLTKEHATLMLEQKVPFIWRFHLDAHKTVTITDLAHGNITFDFKNFSDFPLTRSDGSFTFIFANFVDDMLMKITHVFRGEDHLSNTANQAALYIAFQVPLPIFWHMPIICNVDGKKLSKRDFGFSLHDLRNKGFLPQAINNYLAIIGGSYSPEIMPLDQLVHALNFKTPYTAGKIKYDVEKLRWVNHQWINRLSAEELANAVLPFLQKAYPVASNMHKQQLASILQIIKTDLYTLQDSQEALRFYFEQPNINLISFQACISDDHLKKLVTIINTHLGLLTAQGPFLDQLKNAIKLVQIPIKELFWFLRLALMGQINGPSIHDILIILEPAESKKRISLAIHTISQ